MPDEIVGAGGDVLCNLGSGSSGPGRRRDVPVSPAPLSRCLGCSGASGIALLPSGTVIAQMVPDVNTICTSLLPTAQTPQTILVATRNTAPGSVAVVARWYENGVCRGDNGSVWEGKRSCRCRMETDCRCRWRGFTLKTNGAVPEQSPIPNGIAEALRVRRGTRGSEGDREVLARYPQGVFQNHHPTSPATPSYQQQPFGAA
ncbi:hypothetical protein HRbin28_02159 [bacterium HR28]|nr:hypothetical protein HRbin28_02159 [bacterium HR28]